MKVFVAIPPVAELYPWGSVCAGLRSLGHDVLPATQPTDGDFLVTWSPWRGSRRAAIARHYEQSRRPVIVMENGWLSPIYDVPFYQVALGGWNGTGTFKAGSGGRWDSWNLPGLDRWREPSQAGVELVIGQRGHPLDRRTAPPGWHETLKLDGDVIRRPQGGSVALSQQLKMARCVHVWSSNVASWAVLCGLPVIHHGDNLMVEALASKPGRPLYRGERTTELKRLAWAQWNQAELMSGVPFTLLLDPAVSPI